MAGHKAPRGPPKPPSIPAPSASVVVLSPRNEVLLLHRVHTSSTFASARVFPGGNLSTFHEGTMIPAIDSPDRHVDGPAYRLAAIRETFEESGVLLARPRGQGPYDTGPLLHASDDVSHAARRRVADEEVRFEDWLASVSGEAELENLIPFTRWITPPNLARRYTTQMYLYLLPLEEDVGSESAAGSSSSGQDRISSASADLTEVMAAEWATPAAWVRRARADEIVLFPPQLYILSMLAPILGNPHRGNKAASLAHYAAERRQLGDLLRGTDAALAAAGEDPAQFVPWAHRVLSPYVLGRMPPPDGRTVLALDRPGPELKDSGRRGDARRVVLLKQVPPSPPTGIDLRPRADVEAALAAAKRAKEERAAQPRQAEAAPSGVKPSKL